MAAKYSVLYFAFLLLAARPGFAQQSQPALPNSIAAEPPATEPAVKTIEHWDKLALRDNNLRPEPPLMGQTDTFPEFTRELIRVEWRPGDPIDMYIVRPVGIAKPPVILYLYGYPGEAVRFLDPALCKTVTRNGYAAVGFSSMLTGQRYHDVPMKEWFVSDLQRTLAGTAHDVQMALNYLASRGDFDMTRVGMFGEGSGGTIALLAASVDPRIRAVDVLNPWGDWPVWLAHSPVVPAAERASYLSPDFLKQVAPLDPTAILPQLAAVPLRLQQNLWDLNTPPAARQSIAASLPPNGVLAQYKDEQEYYDKVGHSGKMLDWMHERLGAAKPSPKEAAAKNSEPKVFIR